MASKPLNITTDFSSGASDGDLRITSGFLERFDGFAEKWILPDKWFMEKTGTAPIDNFGKGHLWDCYYNMYSTNCLTSMSQVFSLGRAGEQLMVDFYAETFWPDFANLVVNGFTIITIWFQIGWLILLFPNTFLPPEKDEDYEGSNLLTLAWYKYLSYDQQLVLMFGLNTWNSLISMPLYDGFERYNMANWRNENILGMVIEYSFIHAFVFIIPSSFWFGFWYLIYQIFVKPLQREFCLKNNNTYYSDWLPLYNLCSFNIYDFLPWFSNSSFSVTFS